MEKNHDSLSGESVKELVSRIRKEHIAFESETRLSILDIENKLSLALMLSAVSMIMAILACIMVIVSA